MRHTALLFLALSAAVAKAQVAVDKPVTLTGSAPAERRVEGLADPAHDADALNARTLQGARTIAGTVNGAASWSVVLEPVPDSVPAGMQLVLKSTDANTGPVTLSVNGGSPLPVLRDSGDPLEAGDVAAGQMIALVATDNAYLITSGRPTPKRPCPPGFVQVTDGYCIEVVQRDTVDYPDAAVTCGQLDGRLCTWGEWYVACTRAAQLGITDMVGDWEWTNNAANGDGLVRVVGEFSCTAAATSQGWDLYPRNFRCCFRR